MRMLLLLLLAIGCAHNSSDTPSWVEGIRSGQERFKVTSGNKTLYRRIAETCDKATTLVEGDIEREHHKLMKYTLEVMFYDREHKDCAITVSMNTTNPVPEPQTGTLAMRSLYRKRADNAIKNAFTGLTVEAFQHLTKDYAPTQSSSDNLCAKKLDVVSYSIHGTALVCWQDNVLVGYCDTKTEVCDKKYP